jgi:hypothetical protein
VPAERLRSRRFCGTSNAAFRANDTLATAHPSASARDIHAPAALASGQELTMSVLVVATLSIAVLIACLAFLRERRLRLALMDLLYRIFSQWRTSHGETSDDSDRQTHDPANSDDDGVQRQR